VSKLATFVTVHDENGEAHTFGPGTKVPDWAKKSITNPNVWAKKEDTEDDGEESTPSVPSTPDTGSGDGGQQGTTGNGEPPRAGSGSGLDVWKAHAASLGIEVPADAKREDIFALVDARKGA